MSNYLTVKILHESHYTLSYGSHKKESSSVTLKKIEKILVEKLKHINNKNDIEQLRKCAQHIHDRFLEKSSNLSSFRRWLGKVSKKEQEIKNIYQHIENLAHRVSSPHDRVSFLEKLPPEATQHILTFLHLDDCSKVGQINPLGRDHSERAVIKRAQDYGFKVNNYQSAKKCLSNLSPFLTLQKNGFIPEEFIVYKDSTSTQINLKETLQNLKAQPKTESLQRKLDRALCSSVNLKKIDCFKLLLNLGANPNNTANPGNAPLLLLLHYGNLNEHEINKRVALLLKAGANPNNSNISGHTPLHYACALGLTRVVSLLLKHNAKLDLNSQRVRTSLMSTLFGFESRNFLDENIIIEIMTLLLQAGARVDLTDTEGNTILHLACISNLPRVVSLLLKNGAQVNARNNLYRAALHIATENGNKEIINMLLLHGANKTLTDVRGRRPYEYAETSSIRRLVS